MKQTADDAKSREPVPRISLLVAQTYSVEAPYCSLKSE